MSSSAKNCAWILAVSQPSASFSPACAAATFTCSAARSASALVCVRLHATADSQHQHGRPCEHSRFHHAVLSALSLIAALQDMYERPGRRGFSGFWDRI